MRLYAATAFEDINRRDPKESGQYHNRGLAYFFSGALAKARADFKQSSELDPKYACNALWLDLVDRRSAQPSRLAEATTQIDMTKWSASVIWHYLGQMTSEAEQALQHGVNVPTCGR